MVALLLVLAWFGLYRAARALTRRPALDPPPLAAVTNAAMPLFPGGSLPYLAPYAVFLALVELQARAGDWAGAVFALRVFVPAALLAWFFSRGAYPELRSQRVSAASLLDVAAGLAIAALWVAPYLMWPALPRGPAFDPELLGAGTRIATLALRLAGFALVTPLLEELFVRSFLMRFVAIAGRGDFRAAPIARFALGSFVATVLWFGLTHARWEWWVAFPTGIAFNAWLYVRRNLVACVVAHATANAAIWALVVLGPARLWEFL